jgi:hypothetical protein
MIFSSLPDYRRFSDAALERIRQDDGRKTFDRLAAMLFNLAILAGLWGAPLYARWMVLSDMHETKSLSEVVLGRWRVGDTSLLEFTLDQQIRLFWHGALIETADYRIIGDMLEISNFKLQPGDHELELNQQYYQIALRTGQLIVTPSTSGFTPVPEHAQWEESRLRLILPHFHGASVQFLRENRR